MSRLALYFNKTTNQYQTFTALMSNFSHAAEATETALNSLGSADRENERAMESLSAKTTQLQATFQELANNVIEPELVKVLLDLANGFLTLTNTGIGPAIIQWGLLTGVLTGAIGLFGPLAAKMVAMAKNISTIPAALGNLATMFTAAGTAAGGASLGIGAFAAAALPIAGVIAAIGVVIWGAVKAWDALTVSAEEQAEKVKELSGKLSELESEYNTLASKDNLTENEEKRLKILEAQIKANEILLKQNAQKQYEMQYEQPDFFKDPWRYLNTPSDELFLSTPEVIEQNIDKLNKLQLEIQGYDNVLLNLDKDSEDYAEKVEDLTNKKEKLEEQFNNLNSETAETVKEMTDLGEQMGDLPQDAQAAVDAYLNFNSTLTETSDTTENLISKFSKLMGINISSEMSNWLQGLDQNTLSNLEEILVGVGSNAESLSTILSHMSGEDRIRLITEAYRNYYGIIDDATQATDNFKKALEKDYAEPLRNMVQAVDYIQQSQEKGIQNAQAYQAALEMVFGTTDEALINARGGFETFDNYMSYFENGAFNAQKFADAMANVDSSIVTMTGSLDDHNLEYTINDFSALADEIGITDTQLKSFFDAMQIYGDFTINESIDGTTATLQDLADALSTVGGSLTARLGNIFNDIDTSNVDNFRDELSSIQDTINETFADKTGIELNFDFVSSGADEVIQQAEDMQAWLIKLSDYVSDEGNWDFSSALESEIEGVTISGNEISFDTEEAANNFISQLTGDIQNESMKSVILANFFDNFEVTGSDSKAQEIVNELKTSVEGALTTTNIAWDSAFGTAAENLGLSLDTTKTKASNLGTTIDETSSKVEDLNGKTLTSLATQFSNTNSKASGLYSTLGNIKTRLDSLTNKDYTIKVSYNTSGSIPTPPTANAVGRNKDGIPLRSQTNGNSLVGEEGPELLIGADGRQKLIGQNGPEIINVNSGDTILPANITKMIKTGKIGSFANGRASATGSYYSLGSISLGETTSLYSGETLSLNNNTTAVKANSTEKQKLASSSKSATKETEDLTNALDEQKEIFDEQNAITEHNIFIQEKLGATNQELIDLNRKYQQDIHDQAEWYRSQGVDENSEYIRDLQKQWWDLQDTIETLEQDTIDSNRDAFDERLALSKDYIQDRNDLNDWGADSEIDAWQRVSDWMDDYYAQGLIDYQYYMDKKGDILKEQIRAEQEALQQEQEDWEEAQQERIDQLEEQIENNEKEQESYQNLFDVIVNKTEQEIEALEDSRDAAEQAWNDKIDALKDANDELDKQIEKEEALDNLARARQQKVLVYKDGKFQYVQNAAAVSEAQKELEDLEREEKYESELAELEKQRDEELAKFDEQIKELEDFKDKWDSVISDMEDEMMQDDIEDKFDIDFSDEDWKDQLKDVDDYLDEYKKLLEVYEALQHQLEELEKEQFQPSQKPSMGGGGEQEGIHGVEWSTADGTIIIPHFDGGYTVVRPDDPTGAGQYYEPGDDSWKDEVYGRPSSGSSSDSSDSDSSWSPGMGTGIGSAIGGAIGGGLGAAVGGAIGGIVDSIIGSHADGTLSAKSGLSLVGEEGPELRVLNQGDGILPNDVTKNLWDWGLISPSKMLSTLFNSTKNNSNSQLINIQNLNLPNVSNPNDFAEYMKNNFWRKTVQFNTT